MTFDLILEHWQTHKVKFLTVEECANMDDCIEHVHQNEPGWDIIQIKPAQPPRFERVQGLLNELL